MMLNLSFLQALLVRISAATRVRRQRTTATAKSPLHDLIAACSALTQPGGEVAELHIAGQALHVYQQLDASARLRFFHLLLNEFGPSNEAIHTAYARFRTEPDPAHAQALFAASEPRRQELLRRLNRHPGGTYELVRMRADLLALVGEHNTLKVIDADFAHLFASWFNRGFLVLEAIDWHTPASILEKIIHYEAVHEIRDWADLRSRLQPENRRCYAFFHPATGDEPLIFVEVALCQGTPTSIHAILDKPHTEDLANANTAVFYSISNCQAGLKGISFGSFLIKQVAQELKQQLPQLTRFVTLSPLPGFADWLSQLKANGNLCLPDALVNAMASGKGASELHTPELQARLSELAAHYLVEAKHPRGGAADPVARFHLGNGAMLAQIHAGADLSEKGMSQSVGVMVNYLYELDQIEQNHENYAATGAICAADAILQMARQIAVQPERISAW